MKKIFAVILTLILIFSFAGCDNVLENKTNNTIKTENSSITNSNNSKAESSNNSKTEGGKINDEPKKEICTHVWQQWQIVKEPNCTQDGEKIRTCSNCSKKEQITIKKLNHIESDWIIDRIATPQYEGKKHIECIYCKKEIKNQSIAKIDNTHKHQGVKWITTKYPDCTNDGSKDYICSCGFTIKSETITALEHSIVVDKAVDATCTYNGLTEGSRCSLCNTVIVEQTVIDKLPHTPITDKAVPATCKNTGLTEGKHCSACNKVIVAQTIVQKTDNHTPSDWIIDTEATCKAEGTRHKECTECGKILKCDTIEKRTEHTPMVKDVEIAKGLFCGDNGEYLAVVKCKDCGEKISEGKYNLPERHSMVNDVCEICGLPQSTTAGLRFDLNPDKKSYSVSPNRNTFSGGNIVIGVYNGLSVTEVWGFDMCEGLNTIVIGDCVKEMDGFVECTNLKYVVIGNGVKEIEEEAFRDCTSLTTVRIGDNVEKIGKKAFYNCNKLYYAYISGAHDWRCNNLYNNNVTIYGSWIGKEYENHYFCAKYLKEYTSYEWTRK